MTDLSEWLALRRVARGGVTKLGDHWLDHGRPVPCFLLETLDELIEAGLLTPTDSDPDDARQRRATLTDAGTTRFAELNKRKSLINGRASSDPTNTTERP